MSESEKPVAMVALDGGALWEDGQCLISASARAKCGRENDDFYACHRSQVAVTLKVHPSVLEAIAAWNRRAPLPASSAEPVAWVTAAILRHHAVSKSAQTTAVLHRAKGRLYDEDDVPLYTASQLASLQREALERAAKVRPLEWSGDPRDTLVRAETIVGIYRVWTHHEADGCWFWDLDGYERARGTVGSKTEGVAAVWADYEARILRSLIGGTHEA